MRQGGVVDVSGARRYLVKVHIYLLSVLTTIAAGATLAADYLAERLPVLEPLRRFAGSSRAAGTLGVIAAVVGFVKLFARAPGQTIIVGDFLPAAAGMLLGAMLMIDRYRDRRRLGGGAAEQVTADDEGDAIPAEPVAGRPTAAGNADGIVKLGEALKPYRTPLGLAGIAAGVVHFLLFSVLFL